jgi:hypothetical protein
VGAEPLSLGRQNRATLARQMLLARERIKPLAALERLLAMQAQLPRPPFVGLWSRVHGFERRDLATLLLTKQAVRATFFRGTLHLLSARDFVALRADLQPMLDAGLRAILKTRLAGLDVERTVERARRHFASKAAPFETLRDAFLADDPKADERAMAYAVRMKLPLAMVPVKDDAWSFPAKAGFTPADDWLGRKVPTSGPGRREEIVQRYLAAYGPASVADLQAWTGMKELKETLAALRPKLAVFADERRRELFDLAGAPRPEADVPAPVRFLPEYDSMIATRRDERFVAAAHRRHVYLSALRIASVVLVDGIAAGTWRVERAKSGATLTVSPWGALSAHARKDVAAEGEALLAFLEPDARSRAVTIAR